jgi:hypothetical protein
MKWNRGKAAHLLRNGSHGFKLAIFHGTYGATGSAICLVIELTENKIHTRTVTIQYDFIFDRKTGLEFKRDGTISCTLDSVAQLPPDTHAAMLDIDRKYRLRDAPEGSKLLRHEMVALLFVAKYYPANPLNAENDGA